jgi:hypothetical protein
LQVDTVADRFDDLYNKVTVPLQSQLLNQRPALNKDFNKLCEYATEFDTQIKRLNTRRNQERDARTAKAPVPVTRSRPGFQSRAITAPPTNPTAKPTGAGFSMLQRTVLPFPSGDSDRQSLLCFNCRKPGHISTACPEPPRANIKDLEGDETTELVDMIDDEQGKEDA